MSLLITNHGSLLLTKWRPTQHPSWIFHKQTCAIKLDKTELMMKGSLSLVSWRVTSCAAKIQHFVSYFSFDFAQSYQILAHDQIHYYAVLQQQLRNKTEFSCWRKSEWLGWRMMSPIMSISIDINQPICISNKMSKNDGNCTKKCILSLHFKLDPILSWFSFWWSVSPVMQLVSLVARSVCLSHSLILGSAFDQNCSHPRVLI